MMNNLFGLGTCPVCGFGPNDCRCGYDPTLTFTTTDDTGSPDWIVAKAKEWDGPVVLSSPQFVEPKPHKCPVCEELVASIDEKIRKLHGCEGKG